MINSITLLFPERGIVMSSNISLSDIVRDIQSGKKDAWTILYEKTKSASYYTALKMCQNDKDAEELVQEAYIHAMQHINDLNDPEKFPAWMKQIVCHCCMDYHRKKSPTLFTDLEQEGDCPMEIEDDREYTTPHSIIDRNETSRLVKEMIDDLPADQKLCILLYYKDELSVGQIAETLAVSIGTVKSRLNYGRQKVKDKVLEMERDGVKLYNLAPMAFFSWLLKDEALAMEFPHTLDTAVYSILQNTMTKATSFTAEATVSKSIAATEAGKAGSVLGAISTKAIASVTAICLGVGGFAVYQSNNSQTDPYESAITAYEELLSNGISESGFDIAYYAYLDLNQDDIPELLVSNANGSENEWNEGDVYTFEDDSIQFCGFTDSRYTPFYLVNDSYVMGQHRLGFRFIGLEESITTSYRTEKMISFNGEDFKEITDEEWDYYDTIPTDEAHATGFIKSIIPIELMRNEFIQKDELTRVPVNAETVPEYYSIDSYAAEWTYVEMLENIEGDPYSDIWFDSTVQHIFYVNDATGDLQSSEKDPYNALVLLTCGGYVFGTNDPDNALHVEEWYMHIFPNFYDTGDGSTFTDERVEHIWLNPDEVFVPADKYVYQYFSDYDVVEEENVDNLLSRYY